MDPNVQVALVSFMGVVVATSGVVIAAMINTRKNTAKAEAAGISSHEDGDELLERMLYLVRETNRKEVTIKGLRKKVRNLESTVQRLEAEVRSLQLENSHLILAVRNQPGS